MALKQIIKNIEINASADTVWRVLTDDQDYRTWAAEFNPGTYAVTDWQTGSEARFLDQDGTGLLATITVSDKPRSLSITYLGVVTKDGLDFESEEAKAMKDGVESYELSEDNGTTRLAISSDMDESYFDMMSAAWDRALQRIKDLSESK